MDMEADVGPSERPKLVFYPDFRSRSNAVFGALDGLSPPSSAPTTVPPAVSRDTSFPPAPPLWSVRDHVKPFERGAGLTTRALVPANGEDEDEEGGSSEEDEDRADPMIEQAAMPNPDEDEEDEEEEGFGPGPGRRPRPGRPQRNEFGEKARMSKRYARAVDREEEEDAFDLMAEARDPLSVLTREGVYRGGAARPQPGTELFEVLEEGNVYHRRCRDLEGGALEDIDRGILEGGGERTAEVHRSQFALRSGLVVDTGPGEGELPWARGREEADAGPPSVGVAAHSARMAQQQPRERPRSALKSRGGEPAGPQEGGKPEVRRQRSVRFAEGPHPEQREGGEEGVPRPRRARGGQIGLSYVPDHVKNPTKYTVYELGPEEAVFVGNGYRDFGVRDKNAKDIPGDLDNERARRQASSAAAAAAALASPPEAPMEDELPPEPGAGVIAFYRPAKLVHSKAERMEVEGDPSRKHRKVVDLPGLPGAAADEEEEGEGEPAVPLGFGAAAQPAVSAGAAGQAQTAGTGRFRQRGSKGGGGRATLRKKEMDAESDREEMDVEH